MRECVLVLSSSGSVLLLCVLRFDKFTSTFFATKGAKERNGRCLPIFIHRHILVGTLPSGFHRALCTLELLRCNMQFCTHAMAKLLSGSASFAGHTLLYKKVVE